MTSKEIRSKYIEFFKSKGHIALPSASLIPENDSSTLFIGSGMQPLVPYLMGEKHPQGKRLVNSQKSFRTEDMEEVGDNRHNTFFEMLGNWSLGDYFKKDQLFWIYEFLIEELKIDPSRLYSTVYRGNKEIGIEQDSESVEILKTIFKRFGIKATDIDFAEEKGMQAGRIFYYGDNKNWWSRSGAPANMPVGEIGGPDSEIFFDLGESLGRHEKSPWKDEPCHVNCDCGRFIEIGNSVFIEFVKSEKGFEKLPQKNVDFGGGLERISLAVQSFDNIFETDLFFMVINKIEKLSGKKYRENMKAFEIIADHLKAATFLLGDDKNITPSNTDQGYIIRRLIRRAIRYGRNLGIVDFEGESWTKEIAKIVVHDYGDIYSELNKNANFIINCFKEEEEKFQKTIERGLKQILNYKTQMAEGGVKEMSAKVAFDLYQSHGFPIEMTEEIAQENDLTVDKEGFKKEMEKHQELSRTASVGKFKGGLADQSEQTKKLHTAAHLLLAALRKVLGDHVYQKGSNITAERLRFDFSHPDKITEDQKKEIEKIINEIIQNDYKIIFEEINLKEAKEKGAMGVFESKYDQEKVKVYKVYKNDEVFSSEICGGPHVERTGVLGKFKIKKEQSSSAGVRRIKAVLLNE